MGDSPAPTLGQQVAEAALGMGRGCLEEAKRAQADGNTDRADVWLRLAEAYGDLADSFHPLAG